MSKGRALLCLKRKDQEAGLHYNRYRYYSPYVGRFVSKDPIGLWGGINVYSYTPNPVQWIDPLGLAPKPKTPPKPVEHQVCCMCDKGLAYRVIKDTHNIQNGIDARDPSANYAMEGHVLHGSKENVKTQYISASRTYAQAVANSAKYGTGKERIISIDLSQVKDSTDLNGPCSPLKGNTAINRAKASGEILIIGHIPASAIKIVRP